MPFLAPRLVRDVSIRGDRPRSVSYREVVDLRGSSDPFIGAASYSDRGQSNASKITGVIRGVRTEEIENFADANASLPGEAGG